MFTVPDTVRESISLDGAWEFAPEGAETAQGGTSPDVYPETITVPGCWEAQGRSCTSAWYRRRVQVPVEWQGHLVWLRFGGISYVADVWVNDRHVLTHEGLMLPFACEIGAVLVAGTENTIVVRVQSFDYPGIFQSEQLGDKLLGIYGCWTTWGGIFQPVSLETTAPTWIDNLYLLPDLARGRVVARVRLGNVTSTSQALDLTVRVEHAVGATGVGQVAQTVQVGAGDTTIEIPIEIPDPILWEPDQPFLYRARVMLSEGEQVIDLVSDRFGMRQVEVRGKEIRLNGRPIFLRGFLDDAIYPHQISPTLSEQDVRTYIVRCKEMGFNFVRHHTHAPVPVFHEMADELGLLQLEEYASFGAIGRPRIDPSQATRHHIFDTWRRMIERDRNHASIIGYGITNECWNKRELRTWAPLYRDLYRLGKELDPTRLIIDNSGGEDRWSVVSDVYDKHTYHFPTDKEMSRAARDGRRPYLRTRTSYVNVDLATLDKPCLVTEVGAWATFPDFTRIRAQHGGAVPWWISRNPVKNPRMCHDVIARMEEGFALMGLADLYPTIVANSERYAEMGNKLQVEQMRQTPGIAGYAYCTFMDSYNWTCGLVDNYLIPKSHAAGFTLINQPSIILWPRDRWCFWCDETVPVALRVSHYGDQPLQGSVRWRLLDGETALAEGALEGVDLSPYQVHDLPSFDVALSHAPCTRKLRLDVSCDGDQERVQNSWDLWAFTRPTIDLAGTVVGVHDPAQTQRSLRDAFPMFVPVSPEQLDQAGVVITTVMTEALVRYLDGGGHVLWLQDGQEESCRPYWNIPMVDYHATLIGDHPALGAFPHEGWCDLQFHALIGRAVVDTGYFPPRKLDPIIEAFHVPFATSHPRLLPFRRKGFLAEARVGRGYLLTTTLLFDGVADHPEAHVLLSTLVTYLASPSAEPVSVLEADELREWAWGSAQGPEPVDFVEFSFS